MPVQTQRYSNRLYVGACVSLLVLIFILGLSIFTNYRTKGNNQWVNHTFSVIGRLHEIEKDVLAAHNSMRAFILTAQPRYEEDVARLRPIVLNHLYTLKTMLADNPVQSENLQALETHVYEQSKSHDENINYVKNGKTNIAVQNIKSGLGQNQLEKVVEHINKMEDLERHLLQERLYKAQGLLNSSNVFIVLGSILTILLISIGLYIVISELKRRREAELSLEQQTVIQKIVLDSSPVAIIATDNHWQINLFNPAAEKLLGYKASEVLGKSPAMFHVPDEVAQMANKLSEEYGEMVPAGFETFIYLADRGLIIPHDWTYIRKDGSRVTVSLFVSPRKDEHGVSSGYIGMATDITQQRQYETELVEAREQALAGTRAKTEFLANMSHEIRTPMNAIIGMAEILSDTNLSDEQRKYVNIFKQAGESLLNIINDILDLSKIEAGHFELDHTSFDLTTVIRKSVDLVALKAHQNQLELIVDLDPMSQRFYLGDPNRIRQIILNLLGNAVKFTKRGEILLRVGIDEERNGYQNIHIEVQDTGIGMTVEQTKKLFNRFEQIDNSITKEFGGTGLGLNIVKRLVDLMKGSISVTSSAGIGTRFTIKLPLEVDNSRSSEEPEFDFRGKRIMIVDDTRTNRYIMRKILESEGVFITEAEDGKEALNCLNKSIKEHKPFDIILIDGRMPNMTGFELAENIRSSHLFEGPRLIMLTSDNRPGDIAKAKRLEMSSYLIKPIMRDDLLQVLARALEGHKDFEGISPGHQEQPDPVAKELPGELRLLVVDDNQENRMIIKSFLKSLPWKIDEAKNGLEAINYYKQNNYDLVLMDMQMPIMDGFTAVKEIRKIEKQNMLTATPVIALTAYVLKEEVEKSLEVGCNHHLAKPVSKDNLIKTITSFTSPVVIKIDEDLIDLIPDYISKRHGEVHLLKEALEKSEFDKIRELAHKLRGSAGSYGFDQLSEIGQVIEENCKDENFVVIRQAIGQYELYLKRLKIT